MKRILTILLIFSVILGAFCFSVQADDENIASKARLTTDLTEKTGYSLAKIADGQISSPFVTKKPEEGYTFPYYIDFDYGEYNVMLSQMNLYTKFGLNAGITNFDFKMLQNGEWVDILSHSSVEWYTSLADEEERVFYFADVKPVSNKFRLVINSANLSWTEFRIEELELLGRTVGLADKKNISAMKTGYFRKATTGSVLLPENSDVKFDDGTSGQLGVTWSLPEMISEGFYTVSGTIPYYDEIPQFLVDVYDANKDISAYSGHWASEYITDALQSGFLGGIPTNDVSYVMTRGDAALYLFRRGNYKTDFIENTYSDIADNQLKDVYLKMLDLGVFDNVINDGTFGEKTSLTRLDGVKLMLAYSLLNQVQPTTKCEPAFSDIANLAEADRQAIVSAYKYGIINNAQEFRPNDELKLCEFISMNASDSQGDTITKKFSDNGKVLKNPYMGMMTFWYDNMPMKYDNKYESTENFSSVTGLNTIYLRPSWSYIEPTEGEYDFSIVDTLIERFRSQGYQVAMRLTDADQELGTPKWVYDKGAAYIRCDSATGLVSEGGNTMPVYRDPIFRECYGKFLDEMAKRYDNNPDIAFVEIGAGYWGEGNVPDGLQEYTVEDVRYRMNSFKERFKTTPLVFMVSHRYFSQLKDEVIANKMGTRCDSFSGSSINAPFFTGDLYDARVNDFDGIWQVGPCVLELCHYSWCVGNGYWDKPEILLDTVWDFHISYFGLHGFSLGIQNENPELMESLAKKIGYRILPEKVTMDSNAVAHERLNVSVNWKNKGVAPCYNGAYPCLTLKDKKGAIVSVMVDNNFNIKDLTVAKDSNPDVLIEQKGFKLNDVLPGGDYEAYLSLGSLSGEPQIAMPIDGDDGDRRYYIGDVHVNGDYKVSAVQSGTNSLTLTFDVHDTCGGYDYCWPQIDLFEMPMDRNGKVGGDYGVSLRDDYLKFEAAIREKSSCTSEIPINIPANSKDKFKGKSYKVYFSMDNLVADYQPDVGMALSDDGLFSTLGTISFDENLNMTFTPQ